MVTKTYKCPSCGAELKWSPTAQCWQCEYCDAKFGEDSLNDINQNEQKRFEADLDTEPSDGETVTYKCSYCGAELITTKETAATFCVYCHRPVILEKNLSGEFKPDMIIPFKNTKEDALNTFKNYIGQLPFLPDDFKNEENIQKVTGIYIPFWLVDADLSFCVQGEGDQVTHWSDNHYKYTKTDTYGFIRSGNLEFCSIPADASKKTDDKIMDSIEPFDFSEMVPFKMPYLSGFLAEKYDVELHEVMPRIFNRCKNTTERNVRGTIHYGAIRKFANDYNITRQVPRYVLLPVWMLYTQYKDKSFVFAMNGQSGKMIGNSPISVEKVMRFALLSFLSSSFVAVAASFLFFLGGTK
ncbi:MAG: DNA helicase PriA [Lachnospiraceae bacterium]|nr:DNA helicase PriA [Lachnospiraceae bacterium]